MFKSIKNLKDWYVVFMETGLILALLILLSAFKLEMRADRTITIENRDIDVIRSIEIPITENKEKPPVPAKPSVMIEVPNDKVLDVDITDLDIAWSTDDYVAIPNHSGSKDEEETVFVAVEEYPEIIGGMESLYDNIHYPQNARLAGIEGTVIVQFVVNKKGSVPISVSGHPLRRIASYYISKSLSR